MPKPLAAMVVDTYNHARFVEQATASVVEKDCRLADAETVVVDDGSTNRTPELVRRFELHMRSNPIGSVRLKPYAVSSKGGPSKFSPCLLVSRG